MHGGHHPAKRELDVSSGTLKVSQSDDVNMCKQPSCGSAPGIAP